MSKVYFKTVKKMEIENQWVNYHYHILRKQAIKERHKVMAEMSESSEIDEEGELVDNLYSVANFGTGKNDEQHA